MGRRYEFARKNRELAAFLAPEAKETKGREHGF
jgi:hypothetical protein